MIQLQDSRSAQASTLTRDARITSEAATSRYRIGNLHEDTQVCPDPEMVNRFHGFLPNSWNIFKAFGGATMTMGLQAARTSLGREDLVPLSASAVFPKALDCGPVQLEVETVRAGAQIVQCTVDLKGQDAAESALRLNVVFGKKHDHPLSLSGRTFPSDVLPPEECQSLTPPRDWPLTAMIEAMPWFHQFDKRLAVGTPAWEPAYGGGEPRVATWIRYKNPPRRSDGTIDPLTYAGPGDDLAAAVGEAFGPAAFGYQLLTLEMNVDFFATTTHEWLLQHVRIHHIADGYVQASVELWDPDGQLLAVVSQRALVRLMH